MSETVYLGIPVVSATFVSNSTESKREVLFYLFGLLFYPTVPFFICI